MKLIDKDALVAEIRRMIKNAELYMEHHSVKKDKLYYSFKHLCLAMYELLSFIDTLKVKDPYEQCIQYDSIKEGIQAHAETYSFNIESKLFHQLTIEQQKLWRKEIEQACISGGEMGVELARDQRYKENLEKEVDLEKEWKEFLKDGDVGFKEIAKHFFELGLKALK